MGAPTEIYVDPSIAGDSGAGTIGDPYGDLQYALNQVTRDATNGDKFNIKAGTDEILAGILSFATYGTPTSAAPCLFRGYTSAADDGGIGVIDANAGSGITTQAKLGFIDTKLHNVAGNQFSTGASCSFINVEFTNCTRTSATVGSITGVALSLFNCNIHDVGGVGVEGISSLWAYGNYLTDGATNQFKTAILLDSGGDRAVNNIISLNTVAGKGIELDSTTFAITGNSVFNLAAGTGFGIGMASAGSGGWIDIVILNNLIEGFSGAGGTGLKIGTSNANIIAIASNAVFNCSTSYAIVEVNYTEDNEALGATPFDKSGADTFANRFTYFAPADTGNVRGGAFPNGCRLDKGAVQHADPAGALSFIQTRRNTLIGR